MYCPYCGRTINESMKFCPKCGKPVKIPSQNTMDHPANERKDAVDLPFANNTASREGGDYQSQNNKTKKTDTDIPVLRSDYNTWTVDTHDSDYIDDEKEKKKKIFWIVAAVLGVMVITVLAFALRKHLGKGDGKITISTTLGVVAVGAETAKSDVPDENGNQDSAEKESAENVGGKQGNGKNDIEKATASTAAQISQVSVETADPYVDTITLYCGISAPASDFLFPQSSTSYLTSSDLQRLNHTDPAVCKQRSQMAINEIYVRYGYTFKTDSPTAQEAKNKFGNLDWYITAQKKCPVSDQTELAEKYFNKYEKANIKALLDWQKVNAPD